MTETSTGDLFSLDGKVALITGAAKGLGKIFSQTLAEAGAHVVCADFKPELLKETVASLELKGHKVSSVIADVSSPEDVKSMVSDTMSQFGRLDIAINNAGIVTKPCRFHEITLDDWDRLVAIDLTGIFICMKEELRWMVTQQSGIIVNIASVAGLRGVAPEHKPRANYVAAKHGVIGLTRQAALEYAPDNIRVNAIAPGWFGGTDLSRERTQGKVEIDISLEQKRNGFIPLGRKGSLNELRGLILFLASDASSYVTGQVLAIDGGVTAR
ncbi:MAG: SDR family oxidoreductase [Deltaproteobacteria bacterium]|nr:SDR family oxidoreductase [Deltaproteobacteria bacterium]